MKKLDGIRVANKIARDHGGKCLSTKYVNVAAKLEWECEEKHIWETSLASIKDVGSWCPKCYNTIRGKTIKLKDGLHTAKTIAAQKGGRCLSTEYTNSATKMKWQCNSKHIWQTTLNHIKSNNSWCPDCAHVITANKHKLKNGLEIAHEIAAKRDGVCLATEYISSNSKMKWKCKDGHIWSAVLTDIKNSKSWCPQCSIIIRGNKIKLSNGMEKAHEIAAKKNGKCLSNKYINTYTNMKWICDKGHIWLSTLGRVMYTSAWCPKCSSKKLNIVGAQKIAKDRGGKCLSVKYTPNVKLKWQCSKNHKWSAIFYSVKSGRWCKECGYLKAAKSSNNSHILSHWKTGEELVCVASYEKAVVEYLNKNKINFRWQPKTFKMPDGRTYRPDLYIHSTKSWIEIKGYFRDDAKEKWDWFHNNIKPNSELWDKAKLKQIGLI